MQGFFSRFRKGGNALTLAPDLQTHVFLDAYKQIVYVDIAKRDDPDLALFLEQHDRATGTAWDIQHEHYADLQNRRAQERQRAHVAHPTSAKTTNTDNNARSQAFALIRQAAQLGASDIHIHRLKDYAEVRVRIKKNVLVLKDMSIAEGDALLVALYRLGSTQDPTIREGETQDGGISGSELEGTGLENVRIVRGPSYPAIAGGGHMELRLQYKERAGSNSSASRDVELRKPRTPAGDLMLKSYGFDDAQIDKLLYIASSPSGLLLLTGPTGSGKTTSIFELAKWQARTSPNKRTVTIEQPVEYPMPWAVQLEISNALTGEEAGLQFKENLRYSLRMDPDRLVIGEIRDAEVALTSFDASQTGHSVMSTLHIEDPFDFPLRFQNMNSEKLPFRTTCVSTIIRGVVAQRLLPLLCDHCKKRWDPSDPRLPKLACEALLTWGDSTSICQINQEGCAECSYTGVASVTAVAEVVETDEELMNDFITRGVTPARRRYRSRPDADKPMVERAIAMALDGKVDPQAIISEVERIPFRDKVERDRRIGRRERELDARKAEEFLNEEPA
ncbi:Flp pilus assembly complex ATPase component TadA [Asaia spathodeae]|uniref:Flp pilus assembly complex ATPase component TadA n=2 Tax=Acetobacteraceae TaxID=433 RepID=A0ABX2P852_9PROT